MFDINIVANYITILRFKQLTEFKLDLGKSIVDRATKSIQVDDNFLAYQMYELDKMVYKIGTFGKINFYYNNSLPDKQIDIYFDKDIHTKELNQTNIQDWIVNNLYNIEKSYDTVTGGVK